jgi:cobalt-zinc-cadmium efflux system membrane fusion protein
MHAALTVFEKDIAKVKARQKVMVSFIDEPGVEYECEIFLVTKNVDDNRSALVHCHFGKQPERLLPGMFLNARIKISDAEVLAVPEEAVVRYGNTQYILLTEEKNSFRLMPVETGMKDAGMVEVFSKEKDLVGLNIIIKNPYPVLSALKNTPEEE